MSSIQLTQTDLNEPLRGLTEVEILMFLPDENVSVNTSSIVSNKKALSYTSNMNTLVEFSSLPQANIATFENNLWLLDGSFVTPSEAYGGGGDSYSGYISDDYTDDNGDYTINPVITIPLNALLEKSEYVTLRFTSGVDSSYPKAVKIKTYNADGGLIREHLYETAIATSMPLLIAEIQDSNVSKFEFEFVGTVCPHRRTRLSKIMFGKAELVNNDMLQSWSISDKASLVADSIPTKSLTYTIINYDGDYDIDNPGNKIPKNYEDCLVLFTLSSEVNGLWKYAPTKTFNLTDISTSAEGTVTFECGSILDILTDVYDQDIFEPNRTIETIMNKLLVFSGKSSDSYVLNEFGSTQIQVPLPEMSVRELIQRLAFSCGATLTVDDDNKIIFSKKNIIPTSSTPKYMFNKPNPFNSVGVLMDEPHAEALSHTTDIAMYTYQSDVDTEESNVGTVNISTATKTKLSYSPVLGTEVRINIEELDQQHASIGSVTGVYSSNMIATFSWTSEATLPIKVSLLGKKVTTTKMTPKFASMDTLILDSGLTSTIPTNLQRGYGSDPNNPNTFYYTDWYGAQFKYKCKTRKEYLLKAGDIIYFETPFTNRQASKVGYVLYNSYSNNQDTGEMEVIVLDIR